MVQGWNPIDHWVLVSRCTCLTRGLPDGVGRVNSTRPLNTPQGLRNSAACVAFPLPCLTLEEATDFEENSIGKLSIADHLLRWTLSRCIKYR